MDAFTPHSLFVSSGRFLGRLLQYSPFNPFFRGKIEQLDSVGVAGFRRRILPELNGSFFKRFFEADSKMRYGTVILNLNAEQTLRIEIWI